MNTVNETSEQNQSLWMLAASPAIWTAHFLLCYSTASIWCGMVVGRDGSLSTIRLAIAAYTVVALFAIGIIVRFGYRRHRLGNESLPHDTDLPEDRHRFLGFATLLLSGLSTVATIYVALAVMFIGDCH
jgi:hypothetical protein